MTKCFSVPWKVQTAFLFAAPPLTACGGFVYVRLCKEKKKSTCYLRAGQINPEEDLLV